MDACYGNHPQKKKLSRSEIIRRKRAYKKRVFIRKVVIFGLITFSLLLLFGIAMLVFYLAVDDGESFYPESSAQDNAVESNLVSPNSNGDFSVWNGECDFNLIVVNKDNELPKKFENNLVDFRGVQIDKRIEESLSRMMNDASNESVNLWISSAFRSVKEQAEILDDEVSEYLKKGNSRRESEKLAKEFVAEPGKSEHHTGLAIDFNGVSNDFVNTNEYKWLCENAQNYGFILRYPEDKKDITGINFEPWHFRFVGVNAAKNMHGKNICLEEYIESIKTN